jgi:hypothetical protein
VVTVDVSSNAGVDLGGIFRWGDGGTGGRDVDQGPGQDAISQLHVTLNVYHYSTWTKKDKAIRFELVV